ncbi:MAG TPA: HAMP domain-containing sensor histidine kinase, partial [Candidatus Dormibacteraeota bacterium]|nr:HAMP domain-containing sensor histidine kinase [Candidatus Dormibacteraeota bacterium]
MQSEVDVALDNEELTSAARRHLGRIAGEVRRMRDITDSLLLLAQADAGALDLSVAAGTIDVVDFFEATLSRWRDAAEARGARLDQQLPDEGRMTGDADLLARVFDNLLDNALRHGGEAPRITVTVSGLGGAWVIAVADDGPGVPETVRPRLFERFARGESRSTRGTGLGLALAAAIVAAHHGTLRLDAGAGTGRTAGARFVVTLPAPRDGASP